jgi:hypothetical protein
MIEQFFIPTCQNPCIIQVNYESGDISFYNAKGAKMANLYKGRVVAIFKPKSITSSVINDTTQNNQ